jgi:hypothetical protein
MRTHGGLFSIYSQFLHAGEDVTKDVTMVTRDNRPKEVSPDYIRTCLEQVARGFGITKEMDKTLNDPSDLTCCEMPGMTRPVVTANPLEHSPDFSRGKFIESRAFVQGICPGKEMAVPDIGPLTEEASKNIDTSHSSKLIGSNPHEGLSNIQIKSEKSDMSDAETDPDPVPCELALGFTNLKHLHLNQYGEQSRASYPIPISDFVVNRAMGVNESYAQTRSSPGDDCCEKSDYEDLDDFEVEANWSSDQDSDMDCSVEDGSSTFSENRVDETACHVASGQACSAVWKQTEGINIANTASNLSGEHGEDEHDSSDRGKNFDEQNSTSTLMKNTFGKEIPVYDDDITCTICFHTFLSKEKHAKHMRLHVNVTKCQQCSYTLDPEMMMKGINKCKVAMAVHRKKYHPEFFAVKKCSLCDFALDTNLFTSVSKCVESMMTHRRNMHPEHFRGSLVPKRDQSQEPDDANDQVEEVSCTICSKTFTSKAKHKMHFLQHQRTFQCGYCDFSIDHKQLENFNESFTIMTNHRKVNHPEHYQKYLCDICGCGLAARRNLLLHKASVHNIVTSATRMKCPHCDVVLPSKCRYATHVRRYHPQHLPCNVAGCDKVVASRASLTAHKRIVHTLAVNKKFVCTYEGCNHACATNGRLQTHIRQTHLRQRNFHCDFPECGKGFFSPYNLMVHKRVHSNEKPLQCPHCHYRAAQQNSMNWHMKKHDNVDMASAD